MDVKDAGWIDFNVILIAKILRQTKFVFLLNPVDRIQKADIFSEFFQLLQFVEIRDPLFSNFLKTSTICKLV